MGNFAKNLNLGDRFRPPCVFTCVHIFSQTEKRCSVLLFPYHDKNTIYTKKLNTSWQTQNGWYGGVDQKACVSTLRNIT